MYTQFQISATSPSCLTNILGSFSEIVEILHKEIIDEVIICVSENDFSSTKEVFEACEKEGVQIRLNSDFFGHLAKRISVDYVYNIPIVSFFTTPTNEWAFYLKRLMDIFISAFLLITLSPLFIITAIDLYSRSKN